MLQAHPLYPGSAVTVCASVRRPILICSLLFIAGCSSIADDDRQVMTVETKPSGAECTLQNEQGKFVVASTPGTVTINTACEDLSVTCKKDGYKAASASLQDSHKGIVWGNVLFGGIVGYAVDRSSGAAGEYPSTVTVIIEEK